jgi:hypothetical protein
MGLTAIAPATPAVAASLTNDLNTDIFLLATIFVGFVDFVWESE